MPRDPERIAAVMVNLEALWRRFPDMRLGQLVVNLSGGADTFNIEDDEMLANIIQVQQTDTFPRRPHA